jgi:hypothetical protein
MGKFIWHEHARYVSITASACKLATHLSFKVAAGLTNKKTDTVWAAYFAMVYRKFFWDFVNGIRRNPGGIQYVLKASLSPPVPECLLCISRPAKQDAFFISIIVKAPVIPIISLLLGLVILALEYPAPFIKGTSAYRSMVIRIVLLVFQVFFAILFYQVRRSCHNFYCHQMTESVLDATGDEWGHMVACRYLWIHPRHDVRGSDGRSKGQQSQEGACLD